MTRGINLPIFSGLTVKEAGGILTAAVVLAAAPFLMPNEFILHTAQSVAFTYIVVLSLNFLVGFSGQVSLGHAGFYGLGAYTSALLVTKLNLPFWAGLTGAILLSAVFGALVALPALRAKGPYLAMVSIAFGLLVEIAGNRWVSLTGGPMGVIGIPKPSPFGEEVSGEGYFWIVAGAALVCHLLTVNLKRSRVGRLFKALGNSEIASEAVGVDVYRWKVIAFAFSACLAGIGGALYAHQNGFVNSDSFTLEKSVLFLVGVIVGGSGTVYGPLLGTAVVVLVPQIFSAYYDYHLMIFGSILLLSLILLPDGIVGTIEDWLRRRSAKARSFESEPVRSRQDWRAVLAGLKADQPARDDDVLLEIRGLTKDFAGLRAVNSVDLSLKPGSVHGLIGPNGSGKSTFINLVTGVYRSTSGSAKFRGQEIGGLKTHQIAARGLTRTFQNLQIFNDLSVLENVLMGFHLHYRSGFFAYLFRTSSSRREEEDFRDRALALLTFMGIEGHWNEDAASLPYGSQRLLEIARGLATGCRVLFLDEPAAGVSTGEVAELSKALQRLKETGLTLLLVEHHVEMVMELSDEVTVLDFGERIAHGRPEAVRVDPRVREAYLGGGLAHAGD